MSEIINTHSGENPVKEGLKSLIKGVRTLKYIPEMIQDLPKELLDIVQSLEQQGVDFSKIDQEIPLIEALIRSFNKAYPQEKIQPPIDYTKSVVSETLNNPKIQAWNKWLQDTGTALGRSEDDIEINGNIVEVKIPGYKKLVFDPSEYKIGGQKWNDNTNKFSKKDFEKLVEFVGGNNMEGSWQAGKSAVSFFRDVLRLETGKFYWSSSCYDYSIAWGLDLNENEVNVGYNSQDYRKSTISSQNL